ncbi:MAG: hypothetical protein OSB41_15115, partial [Kiritimatiellae bacterium]|nr:hypothetical protein [Kiritimatiellia bacterium]
AADFDYKSGCQVAGIGAYFSFMFKSNVNSDTEERQYFFDELDHYAELDLSRQLHASKMGIKATDDDAVRRDQEHAAAVVGQKRKARSEELASLPAPQQSSASSSTQRVEDAVRGGKANAKGKSPLDAVIQRTQATWAYDGSWLHGDHRGQPPAPKRKDYKGQGGGGTRHTAAKGK